MKVYRTVGTAILAAATLFMAGCAALDVVGRTAVTTFQALTQKFQGNIGFDPARITGWVFAKVPVKDASGRSVEVDKFLKPYDLL